MFDARMMIYYVLCMIYDILLISNMILSFFMKKKRKFLLIFGEKGGCDLYINLISKTIKNASKEKKNYVAIVVSKKDTYKMVLGYGF